MAFVKRPTSPLLFEPLETEPEDLIWPGSDDEDEEDVREKKRARVEILGKQYLDGRPLFIQSAGIHGPLNDNWVNPWVNKKRKNGWDARHVVEAAVAPRANSYRADESEGSFVTAKRKVSSDAGLKAVDYGLDYQETLDERAAKRMRHQQREGSRGSNQDERAHRMSPKAQHNGPKHWLKTDKVYLHSSSRDERGSPTPTPGVKSRVKTPSVSAAQRVPQAERVPLQNNTIISEEPRRQNAAPHGFTSLPKNQESRDEKDSRSPATTKRLKPCYDDPNHRYSPTESRTHIKEHSLDKADATIKHGYEEAQRLSQEAARRVQLDQMRSEVPKSPQEVIPDPLIPQQSRLAPYVSEFVVSKDAASSAGMKAVSRSPRPSPRVVPPTSHLPEFRYRHAQKGASSKPVADGQAFCKRPSGPEIGARSISTSSSGSSEFAEELEAAQARAASRSMGSSYPNSSYTSSPIRERPETVSVKKNTQAMRRLTFTASGEPKVAGSRTSSRPSSSSSNANASAGASISLSGPKSGKSHVLDEIEKVAKGLTKSSEKSLTNGHFSRDSAILPEAQMVSDQPVRPAQVPSGPSTDLIETDKQSPKIASLDDEDSYINLSTQAAMLKAQRSFQDDILSPLKFPPVLPKKMKIPSPTATRFNKADITPVANGRRANPFPTREAMEAEFQGDEEPMSTQAMADAISPFAITTIKKRPSAPEKRTSFAPSPTRNKSPIPAPTLFPTPSPPTSFHKPLSLSTTPSSSPQQPPASPPKPTPPSPQSRPNTSSKPPSSLTSFSLLPIGTATSTSLLQDGQQQQQENYDISLPLDPFATPFSTSSNGKSNGLNNANGSGGTRHRQDASWDLNAAIEEAGSFLGDWDVEAEAKKEGISRRKRAGAVRGILSVGKGNT